MDKRVDRWVEAARLRPASVTADGLEATLWRGAGVFRFLALAVAVPTALADVSDSASPPLVVVILVTMAAWTVVSTIAYARRISRVVLAADLAVAMACLLGSIPAEGVVRMQNGEPTVPGIWVAATVLAWALAWGVPGGLVAAGALSVGNVVIRGVLADVFPGRTFDSILLLLLAGALVGYVAALARRAERVLAEGIRLQAATAERERLARQIHDGVLQVLALVQRRGAELGGDAAELGRLAGEQEVSLRRLVTSQSAAVGADGRVDVRDLLSAGVPRSLRVHVSTPAEPVLLPDATARELVAAAVEALSNVAAHVGIDAEAWVLVEDDGDAVLVTVRDDGPGIADGRLAEAAADGRLGVAQSIVGRLADLGGQATVTSAAPGEGTEVELRVPR